MACNQSATVEPDERDPIVTVQAEQLDGAPNAVDVVADREVGAAVIPARTGAGQVDDVAGDVIGEVRQQLAECGAVHWPAVNEEHVGAGADGTHSDLALAGTHVEHLMWCRSKELACGVLADRHS